MLTRTLNAVLIFACICSCFVGLAQGATLPNVACPGNLNSCTANDVTSSVLAVQILKVCYYAGVSNNALCNTDADCPGGGTCATDVCTSTSDNIFVQLTTAFNSTSSERYDLGLYISGDGGTVQEPSSALVCSGAAAQAGDGNLNAYPDADTDLFLNLDPLASDHSDTVPDTCGDLQSTAGPVNWTVSASVRCSIVTGSDCGPGVSSCLLIPSCRVWEQGKKHPGSCQTLADAGTGSKCDCTPLEVTPQLNPCATKVCNDNDACTVDSCEIQGTEGVCVFTPGNAGTVCREAAGVCDVADTCDGVHAGCSDQKLPSTSICRPSAGQCDVAESCTGSSGACPANGFASATTTCVGTSNSGACDGTDSCDGNGACVDGFKPATTICRPSAGECDLPESCTGSGSACPADGFKPGGTTCTDDGNGCTSDVCPGNGATCTHPSNGTCNTQIAPTATTCSDFASGTAANLDQASYLVKGTSITSLSPGVMFYYTKIVAPSSSFSFSVSQTNAPLAGSCASWAPVPVQSVGQVNLYDAACGNRASSATIDAATGSVTMSISGATAGETLIVGIKYSISSLKGQAVCRPHPTEKYTFSDSAGGTDSLNFVPKN